MPQKPSLFAFDIFGTVVDWKRGLIDACARAGRSIDDATFERILDAQGEDEQLEFRPYRDITARSLVRVLGMDDALAARVGREAGLFPPFADSSEGLRELRRVAPIVAMTNSDRDHGEAIRRALGVEFDAWLCAEDVGVYKPNPRFWEIARDELGVTLDPSFWHVSAYADYDLEVARSLGLTCCFIERPHARRGPFDVRAATLVELAEKAKCYPSAR